MRQRLATPALLLIWRCNQMRPPVTSRFHALVHVYWFTVTDPTRKSRPAPRNVDASTKTVLMRHQSAALRPPQRSESLKTLGMTAGSMAEVVDAADLKTELFICIRAELNR